MKKIKTVIVGLLIAIQSYGIEPFVLSFKTTDFGSNKNTLAGYITTSAGVYVDTIGVYGSNNKYIGELTGWRTTSGITSFSSVVADAKMGATRSNFSTPSPVVFTWDLKDSSGNDVPDGTYTVHLANANESSDSDKYGTFSFVKDANPGTRTVGNFANFTALSIVYAPPVPIPTTISIAGPIVAGTEMQLSWEGLAGQIYSVETNLDLTSDGWNAWGGDINGAGTELIINVPAIEQQLFYRVITK